MINKRLSAILALPLALLVSTAQAVSIGGYDISAFATSMPGVTNPVGLSFTGPSLFDTVTDSSVDTYVMKTSGTDVSALTLGFASGALVNGVGDDLVLFEIGGASAFSVTIGSTNDPKLATTDTGFLTGGNEQLNAVAIDLSDFGVADNAEVLQITVGGLVVGGATFALAGALAPAPPTVSPIPVPAAVWLFGSGLLGLLGIARRRHS